MTTHKYATFAMTDKAYKGALKSIRTRGTNLSRDTHKAAVAAMIYSLHQTLGGNLNADPALRLAQAIADGQPRNKVVAWFHYFTNVRITVKTDADGAVKWTVKNLSPKNADGTANENYKAMTEASVMEAINTPYWKLIPEPDIAPVDIAKLIANAVKKIEKARIAGKLVADPRNDSRLAGLKALVSGTDLAAPVAGKAQSVIGAAVAKAKAKKVTAKAAKVGAKAGVAV